MNKFKNKDGQKKVVNIDRKILEAHLYNLFNDDKSSDTDVRTDVAERVKTYENSIKFVV